jgi:acyl-[acyl-carrier-protein]-phospholipid O-acyltransferase/long-chain-fatty-acid--[acyl-carrier-protein] ligase
LRCGRNFRPASPLLEDVKQIEYSYNDLLKMALMLGRQIERISQPR